MRKIQPFYRLNLSRKNKRKNKRKVNLWNTFFLVVVLFFAQQGIEFYPVIVAQAKELIGQKIAKNNNNADNSKKYKKIIESFQKKEYPLEVGLIKKDDNKIVTSEFGVKLNKMTVGYPVNKMIPFILKYDKSVSGLIVGIAKKESNWGKRSPTKNGKTCYNYWGYKGRGSNGTSLGYACFLSPEEAVTTIGNRIQELVNQGLNTPAKMIIWKCGRTCTGHNPNGVKKWISDVNIYYNKITMK